jgi:hypothetical protein
MKTTFDNRPHTSRLMPGVARWNGRGTCGIALGSTALVWRSMR